jgi:hypothetical protein
MAWFYRLAAIVMLAMPLTAAAQDAKPFGKEQLDQLTAPIALYPDSLLAQLFMATTYPDEFALAYQWSKAHPDAKGDDAVKMVESEPWDPSVQSMVAFPEVLITLGAKPDWVKNMGDAFLAQPEEVMNSVQRLRQLAQKSGNLKSNEQVKVSTETTLPPVTTMVVQQAPPPTQYIRSSRRSRRSSMFPRTTRPSSTVRGRTRRIRRTTSAAARLLVLDGRGRHAWVSA